MECVRCGVVGPAALFGEDQRTTDRRPVGGKGLPVIRNPRLLRVDGREAGDLGQPDRGVCLKTPHLLADPGFPRVIKPHLGHAAVVTAEQGDLPVPGLDLQTQAAIRFEARGQGAFEPHGDHSLQECPAEKNFPPRSGHIDQYPRGDREGNLVAEFTVNLDRQALRDRLPAVVLSFPQADIVAAEQRERHRLAGDLQVHQGGGGRQRKPFGQLLPGHAAGNLVGSGTEKHGGAPLGEGDRSGLAIDLHRLGPVARISRKGNAAFVVKGPLHRKTGPARFGHEFQGRGPGAGSLAGIAAADKRAGIGRQPLQYPFLPGLKLLGNVDFFRGLGGQTHAKGNQQKSQDPPPHRTHH